MSSGSSVLDGGVDEGTGAAHRIGGDVFGRTLRVADGPAVEAARVDFRPASNAHRGRAREHVVGRRP